MLQIHLHKRGKGDVANGIGVHAVKNREREESCKRFFRFFEFLFAEVGHHLVASREAKKGHARNIRDVVVTVRHVSIFLRDHALDASELGVKVEVTLFQCIFVFHVSENGDFLVSCKRFFVFFCDFYSTTSVTISVVMVRVTARCSTRKFSAGLPSKSQASYQ